MTGVQTCALPIFLSYGGGANAVVTRLDANGGITRVDFVANSGYFLGGEGYNKESLPTANVYSATGNGAIIAVNCLLGQGDNLLPVTDAIGKITKIDIISGGINYVNPPTPNLRFFGSGTAVANTTVFSGTYTYKGRYLNDDGQLSSYNFLQEIGRAHV